MEVLLLALEFGILLGMLLLANLALSQAWARFATYLAVLGISGILAMNGLGYMMFAFLYPTIPQPRVSVSVLPLEQLALYGETRLSMGQAVSAVSVSLVMAGLGALLLLPYARRLLARVRVPGLVVNYDRESVPNLTVKVANVRLMPAAFNPESILHTIGLVFGVYLVGTSLLQLVITDDIAELADSINSSSVIDAAVMQTLMFYLMALAGVGWLIRRDWRAALRRLGLVWPSWQQVTLGVGLALLLVMAQFFVMLVWVMVVGTETFEEQTQAAEALNQAVSSMGAAFLLAFTSSTGEEIIFRGAVQPALGIGLTAVVFTASHVQYALTPATLFILVLAFALGLLRKYTNTTTAIICHFTYNFALMSFAVWAQNMPDDILDTSAEAVVLLLRALGIAA
jgi:hypothetical protein